MVLCTLVAAIALQAAPAETTDVSIWNRRPSRIAALLTQPGNVVPKGCRIEARDLESKIRLYGPADSRKALENYIGMFDVKPQTVSLSIRVESKVDKTDYRLGLEVPNGETFNFTESATGLRVGVQPRINGDGTFTLFVSYGFAGKTYKEAVRVRQNGLFVFCHGPHGSCSWLADEAERRSHSVMIDPVLTVSPAAKPPK
jgi:hypothetical protein